MARMQNLTIHYRNAFGVTETTTMLVTAPASTFMETSYAKGGFWKVTDADDMQFVPFSQILGAVAALAYVVNIADVRI